MKTIRCGSEIKRVTDAKALELVAAGKRPDAPVTEKWGYCSKAEWKRRNAVPAPPKAETPEAVPAAAKGMTKSQKKKQLRRAQRAS